MLWCRRLRKHNKSRVTGNTWNCSLMIDKHCSMIPSFFNASCESRASNVSWKRTKRLFGWNQRHDAMWYIARQRGLLWSSNARFFMLKGDWRIERQYDVVVVLSNLICPLVVTVWQLFLITIHTGSQNPSKMKTQKTEVNWFSAKYQTTHPKWKVKYHIGSASPSENEFDPAPGSPRLVSPDTTVVKATM